MQITHAVGTDVPPYHHRGCFFALFIGNLWRVELNVRCSQKQATIFDSSDQRTRFHCLSVRLRWLWAQRTLLRSYAKLINAFLLIHNTIFKLHFLMQQWTVLSDNDFQKYSRTHVSMSIMVAVVSALGLLCSEIFFNAHSVIYTGAGHIIRISSKSWFISVIPFKKWKLYNVYIHSTQTDIFQVFIAFNFYDYNWQLMKTPNSVSQKIRILWKGSILKTPGATL